MTSTVTSAGTPAAATSRGATTATVAGPARMSERVDFRSASARLRENAGITDTEAVAAVASFAEVGAAARRLRASNTFAEPEARRAHPSFAPEVVAPVLVPVAAAAAAAAPEVVDVVEVVGVVEDVEEDPIIIDLPACEVIYLDPQIGRRKIAAHSDRELRRASLAERAGELLASIEDAKRSLVLA
jgi:hypothetical protein